MLVFENYNCYVFLYLDIFVDLVYLNITILTFIIILINTTFYLINKLISQ